MRIACVGYREWALKIYDGLFRETDHTFLIIRSKKQFDEQAILDFKPDMILFYGWSWIVDEGVLNSADCIMLHPSPLPKYRGGSPLQNQIISGEQSSKVTLFIMTNELDAGDIIAQEELSLQGELISILNNISEIGLRLTKKILGEGYSRIPQEHDKATYCNRRKPSDSELTIRELQECDGDYLCDKIRMLADPYPNAYIVTVDGKKLYVKLAELG
jgi:methionyl-tRNA formyltransferase